MNKKTTIAFKFFNSIESSSTNDFGEILTRFLEQKPKINIEEPNQFRKSVKNDITKYFDYLFGLRETFPIFIEWIVKCKKIDIENNTLFTYRDVEWMRQEGLTWTEILSREGVKQSIKWVYTDGNLVELDRM